MNMSERRFLNLLNTIHKPTNLLGTIHKDQKTFVIGKAWDHLRGCVM
jgi:hypothetical protein